MNWHDDEGRALLWEAYTDGYLTMRGVYTLGGFICIRTEFAGRRCVMWVDDEDSHCILTIYAERMDASESGDADIAQGDFLPWPRVEDHATWICLLADLVQAAGIPNRPDFPNHGFCWTQLGGKEREETGGAPPGWRLTVAESFGYTDRVFYNIDTDDAAEALIRARIQLRAGGK